MPTLFQSHGHKQNIQIDHSALLARLLLASTKLTAGFETRWKSRFAPPGQRAAIL
jgi:hypothetical protein